MTHIPTMGGAVSHLASTDTGFGDRSAPYMLSVDGQWINDDEAEPTVTWVRDFIGEAELLASSKGTYLNFQADDDADTRGAQYGPNLDRLTPREARLRPRKPVPPQQQHRSGVRGCGSGGRRAQERGRAVYESYV